MNLYARLNKWEKALFVVCLVLFFFLGTLLYFDLKKDCERSARELGIIGKVLYIENEVSRKYSPGTAGAGLQQGSDILYNDSIVTGLDSSAGIALKDGTLIELCEESIVTFGLSGSEIMINLDKGCAGIKRPEKSGVAGKKMAIAVGNKRIELTGGDISIARRAGSDPELFVRKGKASISINGDRRIVEPNERAVIKPGLISVEKKNLALESPADNRSYFTERSAAEVEFVWGYDGKKNKKSSFILEVGRNRAFSRMEKRVESKDEMTAVSLPAGNFFWRVSIRDPETIRRETSETRRVTVSRDDPLVLLNPSDGAIIKFTDEPPLINFNWEPHQLASSYGLEISDRRDFSTVIKKIESRVVNFSSLWERSMKQGYSGTYYWRVTAGGGLRNWPGRISEIRHFTVQRTEDLISPCLVAPMDGKKMSRARVNRDHVIFSWEKTEEKIKRKLMFSKNMSFDSIYKEIDLDTDHWEMKKSFPAGQYYWRVGLRDEGTQRKALSDVRLFELRDYEDLALVSPVDRSQVVAGDIVRNGLNFKWKKPEIKGTYRLELSGDKDFTKISKAVNTGSAEATIYRVQPGSVYWRVRQLDEDGKILAMSETRALAVRGGAEPPEVLFPRTGGAVKMLKENELNFSWKPTRWANAYQLELHQIVKEKDKTRDKLVLSTQTSDVKYTVTDLSLLDVGDFYWTIKAVKKDARGRVIRASDKARNNFNINLGDSKIIIVSPEIQVIEDDKGE